MTLFIKISHDSQMYATFNSDYIHNSAVCISPARSPCSSNFKYRAWNCRFNNIGSATAVKTSRQAYTLNNNKRCKKSDSNEEVLCCEIIKCCIQTLLKRMPIILNREILSTHKSLS